VKKVVIVDLAGGLGNQIFLFEIALLVSSIGDRIVFINTSYIDKFHSLGNSTIEDFQLPSNIKLFKLKPFMHKFYSKTIILLGIFNRLKQSFLFILGEDFNSGDRKAVYDLILNRDPIFTIITGYWQNFSYWQNNFNFELKNPGKKFKELSVKIKTDNPIIFHYRLGKVNNKWEHAYGALSPRYLLNSLAYVNIDLGKIPVIWLFSNDLIEAKKLISEKAFAPYNIIYIEDDDLSPAEIMMLLAQAKTLICSNSTFSLCAAKIGNISSVIVPLELSRNGHNVIPLPEEWTKIKSEWLD